MPLGESGQVRQVLRQGSRAGFVLLVTLKEALELLRVQHLLALLQEGGQALKPRGERGVLTITLLPGVEVIQVERGILNAVQVNRVGMRDRVGDGAGEQALFDEEVCDRLRRLRIRKCREEGYISRSCSPSRAIKETPIPDLLDERQGAVTNCRNPMVGGS